MPNGNFASGDTNPGEIELKFGQIILHHYPWTVVTLSSDKKLLLRTLLLMKEPRLKLLFELTGFWHRHADHAHRFHTNHGQIVKLLCFTAISMLELVGFPGKRKGIKIK
jgi:hypothetical protein